MKTAFKNQLSKVMFQAWQLVRVYNFSKSEALRQSWLLLQLNEALKNGTVKFYYQKKNGRLRFACGTLKCENIPQMANKNTGRKVNDDVVVYYDQTMQSFRSFKKTNLIKIA